MLGAWTCLNVSAWKCLNDWCLEVFECLVPGSI